MYCCEEVYVDRKCLATGKLYDKVNIINYNCFSVNRLEIT